MKEFSLKLIFGKGLIILLMLVLLGFGKNMNAQNKVLIIGIDGVLFYLFMFPVKIFFKKNIPTQHL